jgi:hypothetical protein
VIAQHVELVRRRSQEQAACQAREGGETRRVALATPAVRQFRKGRRSRSRIRERRRHDREDGTAHRDRADVRLDDGARRRAFTYRSTRTRPGRKPSARYLGLIIEGAWQRGLPEDYVRWLGGFELAFDERESA